MKTTSIVFSFCLGVSPSISSFWLWKKQKKVILGFLILKRKHFEILQPFWHKQKTRHSKPSTIPSQGVETLISFVGCRFRHQAFSIGKYLFPCFPASTLPPLKGIRQTNPLIIRGYRFISKVSHLAQPYGIAKQTLSSSRNTVSLNPLCRSAILVRGIRI